MKLSASAVAPLVAYASGMFSVDETNLATAAQVLGAGTDRRSKGFKSLRSDLPALAMPWYPLDRVAAAATQMTQGAQVEPQAGFGQWRPANPTAGKYMMVAGANSVLGVHPSTPSTFFAAPDAVLIAEGQIKALSALTAWLVEQGVSISDLSETGEGSRVRLRSVMESLDARLLVVCIIGVHNWSGMPEWHALRLKNLPVTVAFDGDTATNRQVWDAASKLAAFLESRHAVVSFADPSLDGVSKAGVDDFFGAGKSFADLMDTTKDDLPDKPEAEVEFHPGDVRMNDDDATFEEYHVSDDGYTSRGSWVPKAGMAGRLLSESNPKSSDWSPGSELVEGKLDPSLIDENEPVRVQIETSWKSHDGSIVKGVVNGNDDLLSENPNRWHLRKAVIPTTVSKCPDWGNLPGAWLKAMKLHRAGETITNYLWMQMGWVPTVSGLPVFVAGETVLGIEGRLIGSGTVPGCTNRVIPGTSKFGLAPIEADTDEQYRAYLRASIETVFETYTGGAWGNQSVAATVIAAALRPVVPIRPKTTILFYGPPRGGKSWSAKAIMAFWQSDPGAFQDTLPGGASDTKYSLEDVVARVPIWVADDLAPSSDARKNEREESSIEAIIRSVFNGTSTRRRTADGGRRRVDVPLAVLVVTAENPLTSSSVMERCVAFDTGARGFLGNEDATDALVELNTTTLTANEITAAAVQMVQRAAAEQGWKKANREWAELFDMHREAATSFLRRNGGTEGTLTRHADIAADLMLGGDVLEMLAEWAGCDEAFLDRLGKLQHWILEAVGANYGQAATVTPGENLLAALRGVLESGTGHVLGQDGKPPMADMPSGHPLRGKASIINERLGWRASSDEKRPWEPRGASIGRLVWHGQTPVVLMNHTAAFDVAQRAYRGLLPPGTKASSVWASAWGTGLCPDFWKRRLGRGGELRPMVRVRDFEGVPFKVATLLDLDENG